MTRWDPDGSGPLPERIAVGDGVGIWSHDPSSGEWEALPAPSVGYTNLIGRPNGRLYCVEQGSPAGGHGVSVFTGTSWQFLDSGSNGLIWTLEVHPNGELLIGGRFSTIGGATVHNIAWRQGDRWVTFGSTSTSYLSVGSRGVITEIEVDGAGDVVAAGARMEVVTSGGRTSAGVAGFQGGRWVAFPGNPGNVKDLAVQPNGTLVGVFGAGQLARWQGQNPNDRWISMGAPLGRVEQLLNDSQGRLVAAGGFTRAAGAPADYAAYWGGAAWQPLSPVGEPDNGIFELSRDPSTGDLVAVGAFRRVGPHRAMGVATFDGSDWGLLGDGINDTIRAVVPAGVPEEWFVGGDFTWGAGTAIGHVARWTGSGFESLGLGVDGPVHALLHLPNGDLIAGGEFTLAGGRPAASIARWDGTGWQALGGGSNGAVRALALLSSGEIVAGGAFTSAGGVAARGLARWDGTAWSEFDPTFDGTAEDLRIAGDGDLLVAGRFTVGASSSQGVARWDGSSWSLLGLMWADCLVELPDGDLLAGRDYIGGGAFLWSGSRWTTLRFPGIAPAVRALAVLPNGDLVVGGNGLFGPDQYIVRWNGTAFERLGPPGGRPAIVVHAVALSDDGRLAVAGWSGGVSAPFLAFYESTCPASVTPRGSACASSGGANDFEALGRPWLGGTFRTRASGLPAQALTAVLTGLTPSGTPLASILPSTLSSPAGCQLLVAPELFETGVAVNGILETGLPLPDDAALVGAMLHQQVLSFDLGNPGSATEVTSTRALELTLGAF